MSGQCFKTLLIEGNPAETRRFQELLADETVTGDRFDLECVDRLGTGLVRLSSGNIDAVLLNLSLPDSEGSETFRRAKAHSPDVAMIVLNSLGDKAPPVKMGNEGAQDYLRKSQVNAVVLSNAIRYAVERKRVEKEILKLHQELERRAQAHAVELEATTKDLESFSSSVSHDLRNSLQGIICFSEILLVHYSTQIPAEAQRLLRLLCDSAQEMERLIEGLVNLFRLGRQPLTKKVVRLVSLVQEVVDECGHERAGGKVEVHIGSLPDCIGDPALLKQVFKNLVSNAFKFTRNREQRFIEVDCRVQQAEPIYFVRDNGAGFDMQYASNLFGVCQRLHPSSEFEGTGIGLSTVQRIIQRHGGRIWAEAQVDKGATFYFTLPHNSISPSRL
jgi:light-regulated signal transduction histidine kinase (bacteriophytochrome)